MRTDVVLTMNEVKLRSAEKEETRVAQCFSIRLDMYRRSYENYKTRGS